MGARFVGKGGGWGWCAGGWWSGWLWGVGCAMVEPGWGWGLRVCRCGVEKLRGCDALLRWWFVGGGGGSGDRAEAVTLAAGLGHRQARPPGAGDAAEAGIRAALPGSNRGTQSGDREGAAWPRLRAGHGHPSESVLRGFYDFYCEAGSGPVVNSFPLARGRRGRAYAHHNSMELYRGERSGRYRPRLARHAPHHIRRRSSTSCSPLWARTATALWSRSGYLRGARIRAARPVVPGRRSRAAADRGDPQGDTAPAAAAGLPGRVRGLRLYQAQLQGLVRRPDDPLWWTLRRPFRQLTYHAAYRMFHRASASLGANWSLHDLRHLAAYRMTRDPGMPLADVQWVLGHAQLTTTSSTCRPPPTR